MPLSHEPSKSESVNIDYGIAVSNLADSINPEYPIPRRINQLIEKLQDNDLGIEVQPEFPLSDSTPTIEPHNLPFIGFHMPISGINFANPSADDKSFDTCRQAFDMATQLDADYVVVHLTTNRDVSWDGLGSRPDAVKRCKDGYLTAASRAKEFGYEGALYFENLEYPLYPGPVDEITDFMKWVELVAAETGHETGITLDLGHIWHSYNLMKENLWRQELSAYTHESFVIDDDFFSRCLKTTLELTGRSLKEIHFTNARDHQTHLLPTVSSENATNDRESMDLGKSLAQVYDAARGRNDRIKMVNEAHGYPYHVMAMSALTIRAYLNE